MPGHFNWNEYTATKDGDFAKLPAGPYVARITDATDTPAKEYVEVVFDIAEGENAGFYGDDWGKKHPYAHHVFLSYKEKARNMLKGRLEAIRDSNPGFDPFAAWDADRLDLFCGRLMGINLQEEEYKDKEGKVRTRLNVCQVVPAQDVRDGKVQTKGIKRLEQKAEIPAAYVTDTYDDVPFN